VVWGCFSSRRASRENKHQNKTSNFPINPQIFNPAPISGAMLVYRSVTIPFDYDFTVILENPMNLVVLHNTCCLSCQRVGMLLCSTKKKGQMSIWKKRLKIYMSIYIYIYTYLDPPKIVPNGLDRVPLSNPFSF